MQELNPNTVGAMFILIIAVNGIRSLGIAEGSCNRTIAHHELNLVQIDLTALSGTKRHSEHRERLRRTNTIELSPLASSVKTRRRGENLRENSRSRGRSLHREGSRMTGGITVGPNANGRHRRSEGTLARVGEGSGDRRGRGIRVTSP